MNDGIRGGCLCGAVTYEITLPFQRMLHCHCSRCRKGTGTGHATNLIALPDQLRWTKGEALISRFKLPTAKSFGKWFCSQCGSPLPRLTRNDTMVVVPAGSLDDAPPIKPSAHIYWDSRATWGCPNGGLPTFAELPTE